MQNFLCWGLLGTCALRILAPYVCVTSVPHTCWSHALRVVPQTVSEGHGGSHAGQWLDPTLTSTV